MNKRVQTVVFLGPDGAGKSTIINDVEKKLNNKGLIVTKYYFAPGFFRRYRPSKSNSVTVNPHEVKAYNSILVFLKILLMLFEFTFGMRKVRKHRGIVLFDRYIYDLLVDPQRYRIGRVRKWVRFIINLAPKPDLLVVVVASPKVIQFRKQEVTFEETERQVLDYQNVSKLFPFSIVVNNEGAITDISDKVINAIVSDVKS